MNRGATNASTTTRCVVLVASGAIRSVVSRSFCQPMAIAIGQAAPGLADVLPAMHTGEKLVVWVPPGAGVLEPVVHEIELVDIVRPRAVAPGRLQ